MSSSKTVKGVFDFSKCDANVSAQFCVLKPVSDLNYSLMDGHTRLCTLGHTSADTEDKRVLILMLFFLLFSIQTCI